MSRVVWRQFLLAILLIVAYQMLWSIQSYHGTTWLQKAYGPLPIAMLKWLPRSILFSLPFAAGIALALLPIRAGAYRQALLLVGGVTAFLVVDDLALRPVWREYDRVTMTPDPADSARVLRFSDTTGAITGTWAHLRGKVQPGDIQRWPPEPSRNEQGLVRIDDGSRVVRLSAAITYNQLTNLLLPFIGAGLVLGLGAWLRRAVTFRRPRDESLFRLVSAWILVPACIMFLMMMQRGMWYDLKSEQVWLIWLFVPVICGMIPAFLGWRAVWRLDRLAGE